MKWPCKVIYYFLPWKMLWATYIRADFGKGMRWSTFQWKKGFSVKRGEAIQWMRGLVRISTGKGNSVKKKRLPEIPLQMPPGMPQKIRNSHFLGGHFAGIFGVFIRSPPVGGIWMSGWYFWPILGFGVFLLCSWVVGFPWPSSLAFWIALLFVLESRGGLLMSW